MTPDAVDALRRHPLFEAMSAGDLSALLDAPAVIALGKGDVLFRQGEPATRLYVLLSGAVDLEVERPGHPPEVLARLGEGEMVGVDAVMPGGRHTATARVVEPAGLAVALGDRLIAALEADFDLALSLIAVIACSLHGQVKEITELRLQSTTERLAGYLCRLAGCAHGPVVVRLPFEKRQLADRLGMEPATLSRAFARLRDLGVETGRGDRVEIVEIADVAALRRLGEAVETMAEGAYA